MIAWWLLVCLAVLLIGVTKSGFGSGVGLMIIPMTAIALGHIPGRGTEAALGLLLPLLIAGDLIAVWQYRRLLFSKRAAPAAALAVAPGGPSADANASPAQPPVVDYASTDRHSAWQIILRLAPGTLLGVVLGGLLLWWFHSHAALVGALMRIEIGLESVILVGLHWWRTWRGTQENLVREPIRSHVTGAFAGASSTLAHAAGPIIAMYLLPLRLDRRLYVGVCAFYFFLLNTAKLPAYVAAHQFDHADVSFTLRFLPLVLVGAVFGFWLNKRMSDKLFAKIVYFITFMLGWYILIDGLQSLWAKI